RYSAGLTSLLAAPLLLAPGSDLALVRAGDACWLALLWLTLALLERSAAWFTVFQAGLSTAALFAVLAWLQRQVWFVDSPLGLADPRSIDGFLIGQSLLVLAWVLARR